MMRPTCASVYSENPAYTSAIRENSFFSSALSESHGRTVSRGVRHVLGHRVERRQLGALRQDALLDHARQHPLAVGLVAVVELALVLVDVLLGAWCGAWLAPGQNHMYHGLDGLVACWSRSIWSA